MLPLDDEDKPVRVITSKGVKSYEDIGKSIITRFHQHGSVSPIMSVLGKGGKPSQTWNADNLTQDKLDAARQGESWDVPLGVLSQDFGQNVKAMNTTTEEMDSYARKSRNAHRSPQISTSPYSSILLISSQTVEGLVPLGMR